MQSRRAKCKSIKLNHQSKQKYLPFPFITQSLNTINDVISYFKMTACSRYPTFKMILLYPTYFHLTFGMHWTNKTYFYLKSLKYDPSLKCYQTCFSVMSSPVIKFCMHSFLGMEDHLKYKFVPIEVIAIYSITQ
jgi:hypothetical protein